MSGLIHRNMGMELVRVTEAAALACAPHMGRGDGKAADAAATDAMRAVLARVDMDGVVVIGEGEKDQAPQLYNGEAVGTGDGPALDLAVDPLEGTRLLAGGRTNAVAVIAAAPRRSLWNPGASFYMSKLVVGAEARDAIDMALTPTENLHRVAEALGRPTRSLTVFVLDKPRHQALIREIRATGARVSLHTDGDVMGALLAVVPETGVDVLMGTGGTPEGVIAAVAVKAMGGGMQGRRDPQLPEERAALRASVEAAELDRILGLDDLVTAEDAFFAVTAVTDSPFLEGVRYDARHSGVTTESLTIRAGSGSVRYIRGVHRLDPEHIFGGRDPGDAVEAATSG
ncbi:MAG: class II fructose-bisphosphatase [Gemmatimonadota bacterium]